MTERITYWKCPRCFGTGRLIHGYGDSKRAYECKDCDGTGNSMIDGATERYKRELAQMDWRITLT